MASASVPVTPTAVEKAVAGPAPGGKSGEFHIPSLDGIRAVSFMLVFVAHVGLGKLIPGGLGVTIFFFLSGYLITTLLRLERDRTGKNSLRDFYLRRAFRIWPPFYAILGFAIALTLIGWLPEKLRLSSVLAQLFHFTNYWFALKDTKGFPAGTVVYWSLAVEEHFYLVFPCLFIGLRRRFGANARPQVAALLALCALVLAWRFVLVLGDHVAFERTGLCTDTRIDSILFGCILAIGANPVFDRWHGSKELWTRLLFPAAVALMVFSLSYRAEWFRETLRYSLQGLALVPVFVVAIRYPDWWPMRFLNSRLARWVGLLSYSLYLCHQVILFTLQNTLIPNSEPLAAVVALALSLAFAAAVHRWIERPAARARKAYVSTAWLKGAPAPAAAPAAP